jgi:MFS family permease
LTVDGAPRLANDERPTRATEMTGIAFSAAMRHRGFWWLGSAYFLALVSNVAIGIHLIPLLTERGYGAGFAAAAAGAIGLAGLPGRLFFLPLGEKIDLRAIVAAIFGIQSLGLVVLLAAHARASIWLFVLLFGFGIGAISATRASLVADLYGPRDYGAINGAMAFFTTIARALAPIGGSVIHDALGGYRVMLIVLICCSAGAGLAITRVQSTRPVATASAKPDWA